MMIPWCAALLNPMVSFEGGHFSIPAELLMPTPVWEPTSLPLEQSEPVPRSLLSLWGELWSYGLAAFLQILKNFVPMIWAGYAIGLMVTAWGIMRQSHSLASIARQAEPISDQPLSNMPAYVTPCRISPFVGSVFGASRNRIILPQWAMDRLTKEQLRMVIAHEHKHIERGDPLWFWILNILHCLFWFNPFVRHQIKQCRQHAEFICDLAAHERHDDKIRLYASTLLKCAELCLPKYPTFSHSPAFFTADKGVLTMRIQTVLTSPGSKSHASRLSLAVMITMGLLTLPPVVIGQLSFGQSRASAYEQLAHEPVPSQPVPHEDEPNEPVPHEPVPHGHESHPTESHGHDVAIDPAITAQPISPNTNGHSQKSFRTPLAGKVTSHYGMRRDPISGDRKLHRGTDIRGNFGDIIVAPSDGVVVSTQTLEGYGNLLTLDHGNGIRTRYGQLQAFLVQAGSQVKAGTPIAEVGSTGRSTGPHLHFEMWENGRAIDPARFIDFEN